MSQSHFTISFPLKSAADAKALPEVLSPLMPALFQAEDAIGTIHYSRFTVLSDKTFLFLGDFDGEFSQIMTDLAQQAGRCSMPSSSTWSIHRLLRSPSMSAHLLIGPRISFWTPSIFSRRILT